MRRGVTAPGYSEKPDSFGQRMPVSSHKFPVTAMNKNPPTRGSGWYSKNMLSPTPEAPPQTGKVRPSSSPTCMRPPSRHKTPPKAVGLDLPDLPCTPPESPRVNNMFQPFIPRPKTQADAMQNPPPTGSISKKTSRPSTSKAYNVPVRVSREKNSKKRVKTAHRNSNRVPFASTLDKDFLNLFD